MCNYLRCPSVLASKTEDKALKHTYSVPCAKSLVLDLEGLVVNVSQVATRV